MKLTTSTTLARAAFAAFLASASALQLFSPSALSATAPKSIADCVATAPFKMDVPAEPAIPDRAFNLADYGAVADGQTLNTGAFAKAIAAVDAAGGGHLVVPQGLWLTGPIHLCGNLDLHLERGALVIFTPDRAQYPFINEHTSDTQTGLSVSPLIFGKNLQNIAITGEGIFEGSGEAWRPLKREKATDSLWKRFTAVPGSVVETTGKSFMWWPSAEARDGAAHIANLRKNNKPLDEQNLLPARDFLRPKMLVLENCDKVLIEGVTVKNSPSFGINPRDCRDLTLRNVTVLNEYWAQNGDGIDLSACRRAIVYKCTVSCGDDGICMKSSGKHADGDALLQDIIIAGCTVYHAHGGFSAGSNTDGGMTNILVTDCTYIDTDVGIRIKSADDRGGLVHNIYIQNIVMRNILNEAILFDSFYADNGPSAAPQGRMERIPEFRDFHLQNIACNGAAAAIKINAGKNSPAHDLHFENITISADKGVYMRNARNINFTNVRIITPARPVFDTANVENFTQKD